MASLLLLVSCEVGSPALPTAIGLAPTLTASVTRAPTNTPAGDAGTVPPTFTPGATGVFASPTSANLPSITPFLTNTPFATFTKTPTPTSTATNTPETTPTPPPTAGLPPSTPDPTGENLLPNPSFEQGWYHLNGIPELQIPNSWNFVWDEGYNALDKDPWNRFVRPEVRVLSRDFLPSDEHKLFIWDGNQTLKVFKGSGATSFKLITAARLEPGSYLFEINVFPDMIESYSPAGGKVWASDPLSGEVRFFADNQFGSWKLPTFGRKNTLQFAFFVNELKTVRLGVAFRGRWAIANNGWFMDDWSLRRLS